MSDPERGSTELELLQLNIVLLLLGSGVWFQGLECLLPAKLTLSVQVRG